MSGYSVSLDLKKMDYLALDDRHSGQQGKICFSLLAAVAYLKPLGLGERDSSESAEETIFEDYISSLIDHYPENVTAPDGNTPLTSDELLSRHFPWSIFAGSWNAFQTSVFRPLS